MGYKIYEDCFTYTIRDKNENYMFETDTKEKAKKIIEALKKQTSVNLTLRNSSVCECPKCHKAYNCKTIYSYIEYCGRCGQKLNINSVR